MQPKFRILEWVTTPDGKGQVIRLGQNWVWVEVGRDIYRYGYEEVAHVG